MLYNQTMPDNFDPTTIEDLTLRPVVIFLMNTVEKLTLQNQAQAEEIQHLRDEINRLKGEKGKPNIRPNKKSGDISSEKERHVPSPHQKSSHSQHLVISRTQTLTLDKSSLPADAVSKGYVEVLVQEAVFEAEVICFKREKYYSASTQQSYLAALPVGYDEGHFGPKLRAWVICLYFDSHMSEAKIHQFLTGLGLFISVGQISNLLIYEQEPFATESAEVFEAGLASSPWHNVDDTSTRAGGVNHVCQIVCNLLYTFYCTVAHKDRQNVVQVLAGNPILAYRYDKAAAEYLDKHKLPLKWQVLLQTMPTVRSMSEVEVTSWLKANVPELSERYKGLVLEAMVLSHYHTQTQMAQVQLLVCDDAPQWVGIAPEIGLCWIHTARHYKKLRPVLDWHRTQLDSFITAMWDYYRELNAFRAAPCAVEATRLRSRFEELFTTKTGYDALDERIALTRANQTQLLAVLVHPEIPLHNNAAELGARQRVRKRDVSFGPRSPAGVAAWDNFMTLAATCRKLGVNFYAYIHDRLSQTYALPSLASLITERAATLNLGASWV